MLEIPSFPVAIHCITYNHASYIEDAMNGFVMQQTSFPFVAIIIDDASKDAEPAVIENYFQTNFDTSNNKENGIWETDEARFLFGQHKNNKNCYFAVVLLKNNYFCQRKSKKHLFDMWSQQAEFIALCEGDDYWTHPLKLQRQIDFLESHPDFTMCFHSAIEHWEDREKKDKLFSIIQDRDYSGLEIFEKWIIPTASVVFRKWITNSDIYKDALSNKRFIYGDILLFLSCCHSGKIYGMSDLMSVYRRHEGGLTSFFSKNQLKFAYHCKEVSHVFGKQYRKIAIYRFCEECFYYYISNSKIPSFLVLFDLMKYKPLKTLLIILKIAKSKFHN